MADEEILRKDVITLYEDGKHRRYTLLFSVNGGALVVGKLLVSGTSAEQLAFGSLRIWMIGLAMAIFSAVMTYDIWQFGVRMRKLDGDLFGNPGRIVLAMIGGLLTILGLAVAVPWRY